MTDIHSPHDKAFRAPLSDVRVARDFLPYLKQIMEELQALEQAGGTEYIVTLLHYALTATETSNVEKFVATVQDGLSQPIGEKVVTIAEQLMERGRKSGLEQGIQQGLRQGEYAVLLRQLNRKFNNIPDHYLKRIDQADANTLLDWAVRLVDAQILSDIFDK